MNCLAPFLIVVAMVFGAVATDTLAKPEYLTPEQGRADRIARAIFSLCAIAASFAAGLLL